MKQFVKALNKEGEGFKYLHSVFLSLSEAKIKEGIFVGPDIRKLMSDEKFDEKLNDIELQAWQSFKEVVTKFLGNNKSSDYKEIVAKMISNLGVMGCNMSINPTSNDIPVRQWPSAGCGGGPHPADQSWASADLLTGFVMVRHWLTSSGAVLAFQWSATSKPVMAYQRSANGKAVVKPRSINDLEQV